MKLLDVIGSASSNMMRSKGRTLLTIIAIFIGAFTITLTVGISSGISTYIDKQLGSIGAENVLVIQPKVETDFGSGPVKYSPDKANTNAAQAGPGSLMLAQKDIDKIKTQDGIKDVQPIRIAVAEYISGENNQKYQVAVQTMIDSNTFELDAGTAPDNQGNKPEVILPASYIEPLGYGSAQAAIGKTVTLAIKSPLGVMETVKANVAAVQQKSLLADANGVTGNKKLIDELLGIQTRNLPADVANKYLAASAQLEDGTSETRLEEIKKELDKKGYTGLTVKDQIGIIKQVIDAITYVLIFFGAIALLAASFGIINTLYMSVQERTKEIGLMKAMGMSRFKVFLLFSVEAILLGFWGSLLGALGAIGIGQVANTVATESFLKDLPGFDLTLFPLAAVGSIMLLVMAIAFLAGTLPARRAAKQDPIDALRYE